MHLLDAGTIGYQVGAAGILLFTAAFLVSVRWWTDWLGRVLAGVMFTISAVLLLTTLRQFHPEWGGSYVYLYWRLIVFWLFGAAVWASLGTFVWAQFFAPRVKGTRLVRSRTTRMEHNHEEADLADSRPGRHGRTDDDPAGER